MKITIYSIRKTTFLTCALHKVNKTDNTIKRGHETESFACDFLKRQGLKFVERNFRCRYGEIDLIMREKDTLVFVEVRYRTNNHYGGAASSITPAKQKRLRTTAEIYLQKTANINSNVRFDVVALTNNTSEQFDIEWIKNAI